MTITEKIYTLNSTGCGHRYIGKIILNHYGYRCGYIVLPENHPLQLMAGDSKEIHDIMNADDGFRIHGGCTFLETIGSLTKEDLNEMADAVADTLPFPVDEDQIIIGFDCAHSGDAPDLATMVYLGHKPEYIKMIACHTGMMRNPFQQGQTFKTFDFVKDGIEHMFNFFSNEINLKDWKERSKMKAKVFLDKEEIAEIDWSIKIRPHVGDIFSIDGVDKKYKILTIELTEGEYEQFPGAYILTVREVTIS